MARFGGYGNFGGGNMQALMKQAQKMQEDALKAKEDVENATFEGNSNNMVTVVVNGNSELKSVKINPMAVDPDDVEMLEDLIVAAYNTASEQAQAYKSSKMGSLGGLM